ncbi:glycosyl hydrolase, partial [Nocardioides xinjiangensis]|uniref:glycosyl hydrolase n=1 Tax=Nocardioides xinjiangensis TaxID=2817376 RepID=UPI001B3134CF
MALTVAVAASATIAPSPATSTAPTPGATPGLDSSETPALTPALFSDPPAEARPKYRWWLPAAATSEQELSAEMRQMKAAGAGGAEIASFPNPGAGNQTGQGLAATGWGTDLWLDRQRHIYEDAADLDFLIDATMSGRGSDAISVPTRGGLNAPASSKRYVTGFTMLAPAATYDGRVPATPEVSTSTSLCAAAEAGDTQVLPAATGAFSPGDRVTVGAGALAEIATVAEVGDGSWGCGVSLTALQPGDDRLFVSAQSSGKAADYNQYLTQFNIGQRIVIGSGSGAETVEVKSVERAPLAFTQNTTGAISPGDDQVDLTFTYGLAAGDRAVIGSGATAETVTIAEVGVGGNPNRIRFAAPAARAQAPFATVQGIGTGFSITPVANAHAAKSDVITDAPSGTGLILEEPLARPHALTERVAANARKTTVAVLAYRCAVECAERPRLLDPDSVVDLTADAADGTVDDRSWRDDGTWVVYAHQMVNDAPFGGPFSFVGIDYAVDHLSTRGARAFIDYWDAAVMTPAVRAAIAENSAGLQTLFEDSLEMEFTPKWTGDFLDEWEDRRGYDLTLLLPALAGTDQQAKPGSDAGQLFAFEGVDVDRVRADYRQTWSDLFTQRFVAPIEAWARQQGLGGRFQLYGSFPIDTSAASSLVSVPEGEALGFDDDINTYSIVASGAHMSGADIVSNECCARSGKPYRAELAGVGSPLTQVFQGFAGGVNQQIWHGFDYADAQAAKWPGYHAWSPESGGAAFSEAWGPRMPAWGSGSVRDMNDAIGRLSLVLRQGAPRYDLAVYNQVFGRGTYLGPEAPSITSNGPLARSGYTTEFLSPTYLESDARRLWDGDAWFPDHSAYRALVLNDQVAASPQAMRKIVELARRGAPVLLVGRLPARSPGHDPSGSKDRTVQRATQALVDLADDASARVARVADEAAAPAALARLGVVPAASKASSSPTLTVRRHSGDATYYFIYNDGDEAVTDEWTLTGSGVPVTLDPWNGSITPIGKYVDTAKGITLSTTVPAQSVAVVALTADGLGQQVPDDHVVDSNGADVVVSEDGAVAVRSKDTGPVTVVLASGATRTVELAPASAKRSIDSWNLALESWKPDPSAPGDAAAIAKVNVGRFDVTAAEDGLLPWWNTLRGDGSLDMTSGIGRYVTTVDVPASGWDGAYLGLGEVHGAARILVNGRHVPLDLQDTTADLGRALRPGPNTVEIVVASNLNNAAHGTDLQNYGLRGPVTLTPYDDEVVVDANQASATPAPATPTPTSTPTPTQAAVDKVVARIGTKVVKPVEVGTKVRLRVTVR